LIQIAHCFSFILIDLLPASPRKIEIGPTFSLLTVVNGEKSMQGTAILAQYRRNLRGGSQPILARATDGLWYVVKFTNNPQGPNVPFNESMGSELYRGCGLAGPKWKSLLVTDFFLDQNPDCWLQTPEGSLRPSPGLCFGSRFLGENIQCPLEILPGTSFGRVRNHTSFWLAWLIDICAGHCDNRQAVFLEDGKGGLDAFFLDHGHLFRGPKGETRQHFQASRYLDSRIYQKLSSRQLLRFQMVVQNLNVNGLWQRAQTLPEDWKTKSAQDAFAQCLGTLSTPHILQTVLNSMMNSHLLAIEFELSAPKSGRNPPVSILRLEAQDARTVPSHVDHSACA
jgi:hypothetical protein